MLAHASAATVSQAVAIPGAVLGWVMSDKGIIGNLLWGILPEPRAGYRDI